MKRITGRLFALIMALAVICSACGGSASTSKEDAEGTGTTVEDTSAAVEAGQEEVTLYIDIAASLEAVFTDVIIPAYKEARPDVKIEYNAGSSGALLAGIEEANGIGHDLFFSAGKSQITTLNETDGLVVPDSVVELLSNELCLVKAKDAETTVTGWDNIKDAKTMALCSGSVPVGKYSRIALVSLGILDESDDPSQYTTEEIVEALGGAVEVDEADDAEVAAAKVVEGSCEVATIYYSDYYNHMDDLEIIAQDDGTLSGKIIYPVCLVSNAEASEAEQAAAADFIQFLQTEDCLKAYEEYCFVVNK